MFRYVALLWFSSREFNGWWENVQGIFIALITGKNKRKGTFIWLQWKIKRENIAEYISCYNLWFIIPIQFCRMRFIVRNEARRHLMKIPAQIQNRRCIETHSSYHTACCGWFDAVDETSEKLQWIEKLVSFSTPLLFTPASFSIAPALYSTFIVCLFCLSTVVDAFKHTDAFFLSSFSVSLLFTKSNMFHEGGGWMKYFLATVKVMAVYQTSLVSMQARGWCVR